MNDRNGLRVEKIRFGSDITKDKNEKRNCLLRKNRKKGINYTKKLSS